MVNTEEIFNLPKLGKDDTFAFGCNMCGKCCRDRDDVLLTPLDLFKIAKYLSKSIAEIINEYCEFYEGSVSKIPVVRIKPREYRKTCPFSNGKCTIQPVKPSVCALYPLGRMTTEDTKEFSYFLQPVPCGNRNKTQTVRQWLEGFSILEEEEFTITWHKKVSELSAVLREVYAKISFSHNDINSMLLMRLYMSYDTKKDFMPQFAVNCAEALRVVGLIAKEASLKYEEGGAVASGGN